MLLHSVFDKIQKLKHNNENEQTTTVYAQLHRWTSYDVIKHHMVINDVTLK